MTPSRREITLLMECVGGILLALLYFGGPHARSHNKEVGEGANVGVAIERAWKARENRVKGIRIKWKEQHHYPRGMTSDWWNSIPGLGKDQNPKDEIVPPKDTVTEFVSQITFDGKRLRYHTAMIPWSFDQGAYLVIPRLFVYDGVTGKKLSRANNGTPVGSVASLRELFHPALPELRPIWNTIRGCTDPWTQRNFLNKHHLTSRTLFIDKSWCLELEYREPRTDLITRMWVDPNREFIILRQTMILQSKQIEQIDIRYAADPVVGWRPAAWNVVSDAYGGRVLKTVRATVLECSVNPEIHEADYRLTFPPGTQVEDRIAMIKYTVIGVPNLQDPPSLLDK